MFEPDLIDDLKGEAITVWLQHTTNCRICHDYADSKARSSKPSDDYIIFPVEEIRSMCPGAKAICDEYDQGEPDG